MRISLNVLQMPRSVDHYNGGHERCDILHGPCACGAWHFIHEWSDRRLGDGRVVSELPEVKEKIDIYNRMVSYLSNEKSHLKSFFETLQWDTLKKKIYEALENPDQSVPSKINCPAVETVVRSVLTNITDSALTNPGHSISADDRDKLDLHLLVIRIVECIISCAEEFDEYECQYISIIE